MNEQPTFLPFAAFLILMAVVLVCVSMAFRYGKRALQHRERLAALEKGLVLPPVESERRNTAPWTPRIFLLRGLIWLFTGIGLMISLIALSLASSHQLPVTTRVNLANSARTNGASEDQVRQIMNDKEPQGLPLGVALIGLIPIGLGLAYLVVYRAEGSAESAKVTRGIER